MWLELFFLYNLKQRDPIFNITDNFWNLNEIKILVLEYKTEIELI